MICKKCGFIITDESKFCPNCGEAIEKVEEVVVNQVESKQDVPEFQEEKVNYGAEYKYNQFPVAKHNVTKGESKGFGIASLVLGIVSILFSCTVIISFITGILAIIFGIIQINRKNAKGLSIGGIITASVSIILSILFLVLYISFANTQEFKDSFNNGYYNSIENQDSQYYENSSDL